MSTESTNPPAASVVIPVKDSSRLLDVQIAAICSQPEASDLEVIVVDNGSSDDPGAVVARHRPRLARLLVVEAIERPGPSHARNVGAAHARSDVLLFLDADDEMGEGYLGAMIQATRSSGYATGTLELMKLNADVPSEYWRTFEFAPQTKGDRPPFAPGCSIGVLREWFCAVGGFNEDLRGCEDVDFGWRLRAEGVQLHREPGAVLHYRLRTSLLASFRQGYAHTRDHALLYRIHGEALMHRRGTLDALRYWGGWFRRAAGIRTRGQFQAWLYMGGRRWGLLTGSIRHRVVYL